MRNKLHRRVVLESLESRCMLAVTPIGESIFASADVFNGSTNFFAGTARGNSELELPKYDKLPNSEDGGLIPSEPPFAQDPSTPDLPSPEKPDFIPSEGTDETGPGYGPENPGYDPTNPDYEPDDGPSDFGSEPADPSPMDEPSPREVRSVFAMLAALKYPVGSVTETVRGNDSENHFEFIRQQRDQSRELDGGAVAIAVQDVANELEAAPPQAEAAVQSLLEIAVPMDRSAGRYQAFEVLTTEEVSYVPHDGLPEDFLPIQVIGDMDETQTSDSSTGEAPAIPVRSGGNEISGISLDPLTTAEESRSSGWSLTIGLVAFGFVLQLLPKKHTELLKSQARQLWQQLVAITGSGRRRDKVAPFPEI